MVACLRNIRRKRKVDRKENVSRNEGIPRVKVPSCTGFSSKTEGDPMRRGHLDGRIVDDVLAVCVESEVEKSDALHEFFRLGQLSVTAKQSQDKLHARVLSQA